METLDIILMIIFILIVLSQVYLLLAGFTTIFEKKRKCSTPSIGAMIDYWKDCGMTQEEITKEAAQIIINR